MKERSRGEVETALRKILVPPANAAAAAKGAGLQGHAADDFVKNNKSTLELSVQQQIQLQLNYKCHYEQMVRNAVKVLVHQYEFDALVSFAGNPGTRLYWQTTIRYVNSYKPQDAAAGFFKAVHTGDARLEQGLRNRRIAESNLFLYGDYNA